MKVLLHTLADICRTAQKRTIFSVFLTLRVTSSVMGLGDQCYDRILESPPVSEVTSSAYGIVFAVENTGDHPVELTSLSVYTDSLNEAVDFSVLVLDGMYLTKDSEGEVTSTKLGNVAQGWQDVGGGTVAPSTVDDSGALILTFSSGSGVVSLESGGIKSFYVSLSTLNLRVEAVESSLGETEDSNASVSEDYDGLKLFIGREVIFENWDTAAYLNLFSFLYNPHRFLGNLWKNTDSCAPTLGPTTAAPSPLPSNSPSTLGDGDSSQPSLTANPSFQPSLLPSLSQQPTLLPSADPSFSPSSLPSAAPSLPPTTILHYNDVIYFFDILHKAGDEEQIENFIIGNATESFVALFRNSSDVLFNLVGRFQLGFSSLKEPSVTILAPTQDSVCEESDAPPDIGTVCRRFALLMPFEHNRGATKNFIRFWLLQVSNRLAGDLSATYSGDRTVSSRQIIAFNNATGKPDDEEEIVICTQITEIVNASLSLKNITVLILECVKFDFIAYDDISRVLRRRLQSQQLGVLNVEYTITAEYRPPPGREDVVKDDFGGIVEDSINAELRDDIVRSLEDKQVEVLKGATVEAREIVEIPPTPSPLPAISSPIEKVEKCSSFATEPTGLAIIISCTVVLIA